MPSRSEPFRPRVLAGHDFHEIDWRHPWVERKVLEEMARGVDVYYDREWPLTTRFCEFLLRRPEMLAGRRLLVVGAGAGLESVVAGRLSAALWVNDAAPVALELLAMLLRKNDIHGTRFLSGSFAEIPLPESVDLVIASFCIYDGPTADAMITLLGRLADRRIPALIANQEIGGHLERVLSVAPGRIDELHVEDEIRVVLQDPGRDELPADRETVGPDSSTPP